MANEYMHKHNKREMYLLWTKQINPFTISCRMRTRSEIANKNMLLANETIHMSMRETFGLYSMNDGVVENVSVTKIKLIKMSMTK